jgi:hypothetical protein
MVVIVCHVNHSGRVGRDAVRDEELGDGSRAVAEA